MQRMVRAAAAALLAMGAVGTLPSIANASSAVGTDPTGDISLGVTYDITQLGVNLTANTVEITVKTAGALPALADSSWGSSSNHSGRVLVVSLGADIGHPGFILDGDGVIAVPWDGSDVSSCESATQNISTDTITLSAPASCFRYPGNIEASAAMQRGVTPSLSEIDLAIAPQVTDQLKPSDLATVDASLPGGYYQLGSDGGVFAFGDAPFHGSTGNLKLNKPVVGMAAQAGNTGYRFVASDGGVFSYGSAGFHGSMGGQPLNQPVVGMAATPSGNGYWLVATDGGIFAFGDANFYGSMGGTILNKPIVGMVPTKTGLGYWLVASDGGIFAFGDATFHGSMGGQKLNKAVVGMMATSTGGGYTMVAEDGGIFAFGDAKFLGSGADYFDGDVVAIGGNGTDNGYYLASASGEVLNFGTISDFGDVFRLGVELNKPIVGFATGS